jgi:glyoxylase-like metal-dependent hydrolase (beta-lactamase superfamily II)
VKMRPAFLPLLVLAAACGTGEKESSLVQPEQWWKVHPRPAYASLEKVGTFQEWFDVYRISDRTYAIYEPNQFEEAICYLVLGDERGVLIDAGTGIGDLRALAEELSHLPISVVLTHEHYDHVGNAWRFTEIAASENGAGLEVLARGVENARLQRYVTRDYLWKPLPRGFDPNKWTIPPLKPTRLLREGDRIDLGGRSLEVIYTPGHSPGSICLLDAEHRLLFTGDVFFPGPLYAHAPDVDIEQYLATLDRLAEMIEKYAYVCSGHNEPWVPAAVIPSARDAFRSVLDGHGDFAEAGGLRRYHFDGFEILILSESVTRHSRR